MVTDIINMIINEIQHIWTTMYNIQIMGTNLLTFCITITIIGALIPIIINRNDIKPINVRKEIRK